MRMRSECRDWRGGFTLIELLVVLGIIAILISLSASAIMRFTGVQEASNTKTTLNKLWPVLRQRWTQEAERYYREPTIPSGYVSYVQNIAGTDPGRMRVVYVKLKLRELFPMSFNEVFDTTTSPGNATYKQLLTNLGITGSTSTTASYESAACLAMALEHGGQYKLDDIGVGSTRDMPAGTGNIKVLVDAWGTPLQFVRFPSGSPELNPGGAQSGVNNDPTDPQGLLGSSSWTGQSAFQAAFYYTPPGGQTSYKLWPLIVSAGPDTNMAIDNTGASTGKGSNDNISTASLTP